MYQANGTEAHLLNRYLLKYHIHHVALFPHTLLSTRIFSMYLKTTYDLLAPWVFYFFNIRHTRSISFSLDESSFFIFHLSTSLLSLFSPLSLLFDVESFYERQSLRRRRRRMEKMSYVLAMSAK